jgi:hypothetical protein
MKRWIALVWGVSVGQPVERVTHKIRRDGPEGLII